MNQLPSRLASGQSVSLDLYLVLTPQAPLAPPSVPLAGTEDKKEHSLAQVHLRVHSSQGPPSQLSN